MINLLNICIRNPLQHALRHLVSHPFNQPQTDAINQPDGLPVQPEA